MSGPTDPQKPSVLDEFDGLDDDQRIVVLARHVDRLAQSVDDLVSAWRAAGWLVELFKFLAPVAATAIAVIAYIKGVK